MYTISDILKDIDRGCMVHNMVENRFSYRVVYFVNDENKGTKHYLDTTYGNLRKALENIIRNNLTLTNCIVIAQISVLKGGKSICLLSRSYAFCLDEYFRQVNGDCPNNKYGHGAYGKYAVK